VLTAKDAARILHGVALVAARDSATGTFQAIGAWSMNTNSSGVRTSTTFTLSGLACHFWAAAGRFYSALHLTTPAAARFRQFQTANRRDQTLPTLYFP
jgi:hypothetical protein